MDYLKYSIKDAPTVRAFLRSDAFIRGLMGPLGAGKSSACIWDVVSRGLKQVKGPDGIRRTRFRERYLAPADLGFGQSTDLRTGCLSEELRPETDTEPRHSRFEQLGQPARLVSQPRMLLLLVDVHTPAEDEHRPVLLERARQGRPPIEAPLLESVACLGDERGEELRPRVLAVHDRENVHYAPPVAAIRFTSSSRRSCCALVAACETRPSGLSGSSADALLLKKA